MAALNYRYDPGIPVNIVDLGIIYGLQVADGKVPIRMMVTTPYCPLADELVRQVETIVGGAPRVNRVEVEFVYDPPGSPSHMSPEARRALGWDEQPVRR